eukprot:366166-Chlamydomonas_euryale.AAC.13
MPVYSNTTGATCAHTCHLYRTTPRRMTRPPFLKKGAAMRSSLAAPRTATSSPCQVPCVASVTEPRTAPMYPVAKP